MKPESQLEVLPVRMETDDELFQDALLGVVVPEASETTIADALETDGNDENQDTHSILPSVPQRSLLFFDQ